MVFDSRKIQLLPVNEIHIVRWRLFALTFDQGGTGAWANLRCNIVTTPSGCCANELGQEDHRACLGLETIRREFQTCTLLVLLTLTRLFQV